MPRVQTMTSKKFPKGWEIVEPFLTELQDKLNDLNNLPAESKRRNENYWSIYKLHHQRSRYIYEMYYKKKEIDKDLYDYLCREKWADQGLIAKWKKTGYEKLCCLGCIQTRDTNFGSTCICRVPKKNRNEEKEIECQKCGCKGCASGN